MLLKTTIKSIAAILTGLFITLNPLFAQVRVKAADLLRAPQNYYWQQIVLEGEVIDTEHSVGMFRGTYKLECNYGGQVDIESSNLPAIGYRFEITATVKPGKDENSFRLEEINRKRPGSIYGSLILSAMIAVIGVALVLGFKNTSGE